MMFKKHNKPKWVFIPGENNVKIAYWAVNSIIEYKTSYLGLPVTGGWTYEGN